MKSSAIQAVIPLHPIVHHGNLKQEGFMYHKDANVAVFPIGERSIHQKTNRRKTRSKSDSFSFYFKIQTGKTCLLQEGCLKPGAKNKTYSIRLIANHLQQQTHY